MSFLDQVLAAKRAEIRERKRKSPASALLRELSDERRSFSAALKREELAVIAEIKRASPSRGVLAPDLDPARLLARYEEGGAAAVSILTEREFFQGSLEDLAAARRLTHLPLLRKDFIIDPYQIVEAAAAGADAVLLILACLSPAQLQELQAAAGELGLEALVEIHDEAELETAVGAGARIIGINSRNLRTLAVEPERPFRLLPLLPAGVIKVAESGIARPAEAAALAAAGADAILVGEALVRSGDPAALIAAFRKGERACSSSRSAG
ncbi:MAG: indole-3-glycerol phosphate synthase TrpC [Firmicutes bacterium]|nr:indole-3-glycerol phosphate synthase TrpC [Bacillota bacterium]